MLEKKFVPKKRFERFKDNESWQEIKLGENAIIKGRLGWKSLKREEYIDYGPSMIAGKHIKNGIINWNEVDHIPLWRYEESPEIMLKNGDVIFSKDGSLGNPALITDLKDKATINATMMLVRTNKNLIPSYFYQILNSKQFHDLVYLKVSGSSIPHLFQEDMKNFRFYAPPVNEQQKIGEFFKVLDERIANQERKIAKVKALKTAYLTEMFPQEGEIVPKRRFKGFTEEWKYRKLSDLTELYVGNSFSSDINNKGKYVVMDMGSVSQEGYRLKQKRTNLKRDILNKDDLVMPKDDIGGGQIIGKTAHINKNNSYVLGDHVFRLRFFDNEGLFMHYHINSKPINLSLKKKVTGSAQLGIKSINVLNQYITIPTIEEQQKIGSFFKNLDDQIATEEKKLEKLKKMKEAYLEEMFV